ncbi:hypothetical protein [Microbacterium sp.]|uniref:hypothetical protein n=1 Tax=Microbacterium sp. TaxID=51671 RepID=UPI002735A75E|nr:hypothetical protein [Microbacterium sp.]MDP3950320.1 hypothetical protein [Microbacterium sp.]
MDRPPLPASPNGQPPQPPSPRRMLLAVATAGLLVLAASVVAAALTKTAPSSTADWVAGFATLTAFMAAVVAAWYAKNALDIEWKREQDRANAEHRSQAVSVAVWHGGRDEDFVFRDAGGQTTHHAGTYPVQGLMLRNASNLPVIEAQIMVYLGQSRLGSRVLPVIPPTDEPLFEPFDGVVRKNWEGHTRLLRPDEYPTAQVAWIFTDTAGCRWERTRDGRLTDVTNGYTTEPWLQRPDPTITWTG